MERLDDEREPVMDVSSGSVRGSNSPICPAGFAMGVNFIHVVAPEEITIGWESIWREWVSPGGWIGDSEGEVGIETLRHL